jgi:hypothetical protein
MWLWWCYSHAYTSQPHPGLLRVARWCQDNDPHRPGARASTLVSGAPISDCLQSNGIETVVHTHHDRQRRTDRKAAGQLRSLQWHARRRVRTSISPVCRRRPDPCQSGMIPQCLDGPLPGRLKRPGYPGLHHPRPRQARLTEKIGAPVHVPAGDTAAGDWT